MGDIGGGVEALDLFAYGVDVHGGTEYHAGVSEKTAQQAQMLCNRIQKNARRLRRWVERDDVSCYRLYDRDIPEVPLVVDWYEGRLHVAEYKRRGSPDGAAHGPWLEALAVAAGAAVGVPRDEVFLKHRERQRGLKQYEKVDDEQVSFHVGEGGHHFRVNLSDYLDTGLFLDHRITRKRVADEAEGRRFLNLFAYTGSFTVYAGCAGAQSTTTVDMSNTYSQWAQRNLTLNGLHGSQHQVVRADVRTWLHDQPNDSWDLVVVDPPTFSNSKKMEVTFDIQRDHAAMLGAIRRVTAPGGVIYFSSNFRRLKLDEAVAEGAVELTPDSIPPDFRDKRIHRCWRWQL